MSSPESTVRGRISDAADDLKKTIITELAKSESSVYLGWLLPVIHQLQSKLNRLETSSQTCTPLIRALQNGLQKRFGQMMEDPELAAAAVLLPKFKTSWTDTSDVIEAGKFKFTLSN
ncbi:zinc finger BED domain-containing 1-like protein [Labeo rohita]|uniref:Zinc finger BED domain-containing 1-like protein n=1 Tax=Labeo rohita TaxID=84645 RepID=A0A498P3I3_LABRO|nr:zinc finger BED domain-containing 1-like protein [Labeo rohita]